jgi:hypothetical protein
MQEPSSVNSLAQAIVVPAGLLSSIKHPDFLTTLFNRSHRPHRPHRHRQGWPVPHGPLAVVRAQYGTTRS